MLKTDRIPCLVPFCRRTTGGDQGFSEWICQPHWSAVPRSTRAAYNLAKRRARRIYRHRPHYRTFWKLPPSSPSRLAAVAVRRRLDDAWSRCKRAAIEVAAGLA